MNAPACPFCTIDAERVFYTGEVVVGIWDSYPVSSGHALLLPKRHVADWFDATAQERAALAEATAVAREAILRRNTRESLPPPDGFNIGVNVGVTAGQTVFHLHVHVIPRYRGDVPDPRGGVRHVLPGRANYLATIGGPGFARDTDGVYATMGQAPTAPAQLVTGGLDDALLRPLLEDLDAAHRVDIAVAFIFESGVELIAAHVREVLERGGAVRMLTGDYMDATDPRALRRLLDLEGNIQRRVFECTNEGFHPKTYIFVQRSGSGVAYVGSSNLTRTALTHGIEWNYRLSSGDNPSGFAEVTSAFTTLFAHPATRPLDAEWIEAYARRRPARLVVPIVAPEPPRQPPPPNDVQKEALEALKLTREAGNSAGLVVLATGLGKTYLAALDSVPYSRVLFVAHREEILAQAMDAFRWLRPDARMGHYTGQEKLPDAEVLFASIQTLGRMHHLKNFNRQAFDYIVVDEFHHAAAGTYRRLIDYFQPKFLLGLTATPERTDGGDLLALCQENLVYRRDFIDGIRRGLLCPFHYFGVPDEVDYSNIPWRSSRFDEKELTKALATQARAQNALDQYRAKAGTRTLAFCCSQRHADFMADFFRNAGLRVASVHSGANSDPRTGSLEKLRAGEIDVAFAVDMFNEGVDVPQVDTVMMLRPTESRLLWLQQLGRGLRKAETKTHLTVIDYIGNHRSFLLKPQTLFQLQGNGDAEIDHLLKQLQSGEANLPPGCEVTYDLHAIDIIRRLLRLGVGDDALRLYYEDFRQRHGQRPRAVESYHDGYVPRSARRAHGSWIRFVDAMGDLTAEERELLQSHGPFLDTLEITPMTKSYKMLVLLSMLNEDAFPGSISIDVLTDRFAEFAERSAKLRADVGLAMEDRRRLRKLIEENPIAAWIHAKGTGGVRYFEYEDGTLRTLKPVPIEQRAALQQLARELAEWRLAEYLARGGDEAPETRLVCKVSHTGGRPILFLPDRTHASSIPEGWTAITIDGQSYEANIVKVAINVVRRPGTDQNELPTILRGWFGPSAGLPGTDFKVTIEHSDTGYQMLPSGRTEDRSKLELWRSYSRKEIPGLFGLKFSQSLWHAGLVVQPKHIFLLVTLEKGDMQEQFQYRDRFLGTDSFQWQSQNQNRQTDERGQKLRHHLERGIAVHLFVRRTKKTTNGGAKFIYCGDVDFVDWEGERPITVRWRLRDPLPPRMHRLLVVPSERPA